MMVLLSRQNQNDFINAHVVSPLEEAGLERGKFREW